jgi:uncharacterized protein (DUF983 family)
MKGGRYGKAELHAHHGVPLSKGGSNELNNLTTYCSDCHKAIHSKSAVAPTAASQQSENEISEQDANLTLFLVIAIVLTIALMYYFESSMDSWMPVWLGFCGACIIAILHFSDSDKIID